MLLKKLKNHPQISLSYLNLITLTKYYLQQTQLESQGLSPVPL